MSSEYHNLVSSIHKCACEYSRVRVLALSCTCTLEGSQWYIKDLVFKKHCRDCYFQTECQDSVTRREKE